MRLEAAIHGDLKKIMKDELAGAEIAVTKAVREATQGVKNDLRAQTTSVGLGQGIARAWRNKFYPSGNSIKAAGFVYSKAPNVISAFTYGATIKSSKGVFLAIPTSAAPKRGIGGKRINPSNFPEARFGKLRFVFRHGRPSLLVVDNLRARNSKRGGFGKASQTALHTGRGLTTVVMFILLPQVSLKKRLNIDSVVSKWEAIMPERMIANWPEIES